VSQAMQERDELCELMILMQTMLGHLLEIHNFIASKLSCSLRTELEKLFKEADGYRNAEFFQADYQNSCPLE